MLLILDCCHATLFSKGCKNEGRFEILAACAKGLETPLPGEGSFTWALLKAFSKEVLRDGIAARKLRGLIEDYSRGLSLRNSQNEPHKLTFRDTETPFWDSLGSDTVTGISIKRLNPPSYLGFTKKPIGYVFLRASLLDDLDGLQISEWLKTNAPKNISAVHIEAIVLKARRLQKNLDHDAFPPNSVLRKLSQSAQSEVLKELQSLDTVMAASVRNAQNALVKSDSDSISNTLDAIQASTDAASTSIETPILLDLGKEDMNQAVSDENILYPDALESISLRNRIIATGKEYATSFNIPRRNIKFPNTLDRFNRGRIDDQNVLLEFFEYISDPDGDPFPETIHQLEQMTALLCHNKRLSFRILPCLGYVHDEVNYRFGLAFQLGLKHNATRLQPVTLQSLYTTHRRVSLSQRVEIAYALVTALENFHRVGWVHKEVRSDNICFLVSTQSKTDNTENDIDINIDFSSPWLFGFEYARAADAGTKLEEDHSHTRNLYRHPQRWSRPTVKFTRSHDIYSLGIVLMEIASWREVSQIASVSPSQRIVPEVFRENLMKKLKRDIPHQVGDVFTGTITACFDFEEKMVGMSEFKMQRFFQKSILGHIKKVVGQV